MARPGPSYQITNNNRSSFNLIAHDRHGLPDSPLFGVSPRRPADYRPSQEENIETIRDREIKLVRGIIKPDYKVKTENKSSYDLISGIPTKRAETDRDFQTFRQREMELAARTGRQGYNPTITTPMPGSPIRADHHIPASPLYRPGQGPGPAIQGHDYTSQGQGYSGQGHDHMVQGHRPADQGQGYRDEVHMRVDQGYPGMVSPRQGEGPGQDRPQTFDRDAAPHRDPINDPAPYTDHRREASPAGIDRVENGPRDRSRDGHRDGPLEGPWAPVYRPGEGKGLVMADPRTGSALKGRQLWQEANNDDDHKLKVRHHDFRDSKIDVKPLEEFRDHRGNVVIKGFPPNSYRRGYGLSSDRGQHRSSHGTPGRDDVGDPRLGGNVFIGPGLMGARNGGAFFLIKFSSSRGNLQVAGHAFLRAKTHDCGGRYLGMANKVYEFGYEKSPGPDDAIAVFHFPSMEKGLLFFQTDAVLKQPDFPPPYGHAEMWIVCNAYLPDNMQLFDTFLLSEVQLHAGKDRREFFETFQVPFENYLYKNGAMPFVVCSYGPRDRQDVRRHCYPHNAVVTCHLFQGLDHLNWVTNDETYSKYRSLHNQMATEKCLIFKLNKDTGL